MTNAEIVEQYMDNCFRSFEGERGHTDLEEMCEAVGYGQGFMRGRAIEEMLTDNPAAVEALAQFLAEQAERNGAWAQGMKDVLEENGYLEEAE
jgi:DNA-binding FrmR family transcriptional regulator